VPDQKAGRNLPHGIVASSVTGSGVGDPVPPLTAVSPEHLQELTNELRSLESLELHAA
jgi:hypothetical protein